jgi:membrane protease YdiL (CAAX protease family)
LVVSVGVAASQILFIPALGFQLLASGLIVIGSTMKSFVAYALIAWLLTGSALAAAAQPSTRAGTTQTASKPASTLRATTTQSTTGRAGPNQASPWNEEVPVHLLAVGLIILGIWIFMICSKPQRLSLARAPGRPNHLQLAHFALVFLIFLIPGSLVSLYYQHYLKIPMPTSAKIAALELTHVALIAACLLVAKWTFVFGVRNGLGLNLRHPVRDVVWAVLAVLALMPVIWTMSWAASWIMQGMGQKITANPIFDYLEAFGWGGKAATIFAVVIVGPVAEELVFRGIFQSMLRAYRVAAWPAIAISSALFVWMHMGVPHDVVPLLPLAIVLGYSYERCGRLVPSIVIHAMFNAVNVVIFLTGLGS